MQLVLYLTRGQPHGLGLPRAGFVRGFSREHPTALNRKAHRNQDELGQDLGHQQGCAQPRQGFHEGRIGGEDAHRQRCVARKRGGGRGLRAPIMHNYAIDGEVRQRRDDACPHHGTQERNTQHHECEEHERIHQEPRHKGRAAAARRYGPSPAGA